MTNYILISLNSLNLDIFPPLNSITSMRGGTGFYAASVTRKPPSQ